MKKLFFFIASVVLIMMLALPFSCQEKVTHNIERKVFAPFQKGKKKTIEKRAMFSEARTLHEFYRQVNPITGIVSKRDKEQEFQNARQALTRSMQRSSSAVETTFINRGPTNIGGRTRSLAIDKSDATGKTMLAGAVSGGVFRTTDGGASWVKVSSNDEIHNVTTIAQDPRIGFENIWYYGTGETYGNSASENGAFYLGQGIWQSVNGGITWSQIPSTASNQTNLDSVFDAMVRLAVHPITGELYMAGLGRLLRFNGTSWFVEIQNTELSGLAFNQDTDIVFTTDGKAYAAFSGQNQNVKGVWFSPDGVGNWTRINTGFFTPAGRVVLALAPSNQNKLYTLFVNGNTAICDTATQEGDLWMWDQSTQIYADYTNMLPYEGCPPVEGSLRVQGGYDLCVVVKPDNENFVVVGGTSAYKKENITDDSSLFQIIGGFGNSEIGFYNEGTGVEHHPDIQYLVFSQTNPNILFSATDGGLHRTDDVTAPIVGWQNLNNNYQTHQYYHVAIDPLNGSDMVIGGAQDNGTSVGGTGFGIPDLTTQLTPSGADGVAVGLSRFENGCLGFLGQQLGSIIRGTCDFSAYDYITPDGSDSQFVTYFYLDQDNNNALYYAGQNTLYKTTDASNVTSATWENMGNTNDDLGVTDYFQTFSTSKGAYNPATSYLLMGGDEGHIYKLNNPWNTTNISSSIDITPPTATLGFPSIVTGLAVHPTNNDIVLATYSNYGTKSIFITTNATSNAPTWTLIERNLSEHSIRSAAIAEVDGETLYFVGTARGLYSSTDPTSTDWIREAPDKIGFALVSSLAYRHSDNHLLIGTHGNGMYEAVISPSLGVNEQDDVSSTIKIYPNPVEDQLNVTIQVNSVNLTYQVMNMLGQKVLDGDFDNKPIRVSGLENGMYFIELSGINQKGAKRFIKK